jgi:hypothetical protein
LACVLPKTHFVFPVVRWRQIPHLDGNIAARFFKLISEDIQRPDDAFPFDIGFSHDFLFMGQKTPSRKGEDVFSLADKHGHRHRC